ncbi:MAG TPA: ureidoglycolate lyase [Coleofasciculaceae cyanobacterium]|jgi:ureidoglycolate hydrolase
MLRSLIAQPVTPESFRPYGQVIFATDDGKIYDADDAQLVLSGIPRFYIMRLHHKGRRFSHITRHQKCTQCLGSLEGNTWLLAVAPPCEAKIPDWEAIAAFQIPSHCFVKLEAGTWHAGPYFDQDAIDFYNLELSDTNLADHHTCDLQAAYGVTFEIVLA